MLLGSFLLLISLAYVIDTKKGEGDIQKGRGKSFVDLEGRLSVDVVIVDLLDGLVVVHNCFILLHFFPGEVLVRVLLPVVFPDLLVVQVDAGQLVAERDPAGHAVERAPVEFDFLAERAHALDEPVDLVRLARGLAHLAHDHVAVDLRVDLRVSFDADEAVLLAVVQPVPRSAREKKRERGS